MKKEQRIQAKFYGADAISFDGKELYPIYKRDTNDVIYVDNNPIEFAKKILSEYPDWNIYLEDTTQEIFAEKGFQEAQIDWVDAECLAEEKIISELCAEDFFVNRIIKESNIAWPIEVLYQFMKNAKEETEEEKGL